jgi:hypothetical protein
MNYTEKHIHSNLCHAFDKPTKIEQTAPFRFLPNRSYSLEVFKHQPQKSVRSFVVVLFLFQNQSEIDNPSFCSTTFRA